MLGHECRVDGDGHVFGGEGVLDQGTLEVGLTRVGVKRSGRGRPWIEENLSSRRAGDCYGRSSRAANEPAEAIARTLPNSIIVESIRSRSVPGT